MIGDPEEETDLEGEDSTEGETGEEIDWGDIQDTPLDADR